MKTINIGLLGCGTVGTGVAKLLMENNDLLSARVGANLNLKWIADIDAEADRGISFAEGVFTTDARQVLDDPQVDIILEMIGGEGVAMQFIRQAIENGKHVVTANKALLAARGNELFTEAARKGVDLAFEAAVGGCMPIIKTVRESLAGNHIQAINGILNGTCNYILSRITDAGISFEAALAEAQQEGYAEADPTLDVEGFDTAHKTAILGALAYGMEINLDDVYIEGISGITPLDIEFAGQFGYRIKLLAISKMTNGMVEARVHPTMIPLGNLLSNVNGTLNAITVTGDAVGEILLYGHGAGMMPTASAVVSDIVDIARNLLCATARRVPPLAFQRDSIRRIPVLPMDELISNYYFRFSALDQPGVLSKISGILGKYNISIQYVHQKGRKTNGAVPVVMITHRVKEADVKLALAEIRQLKVVSKEPVLIRIEDAHMD